MPVQELPGVLQQPNGFLLLELSLQFSRAEMVFLKSQTQRFSLAPILQWTPGSSGQSHSSPMRHKRASINWVLPPCLSSHSCTTTLAMWRALFVSSAWAAFCHLGPPTSTSGLRSHSLGANSTRSSHQRCPPTHTCLLLERLLLTIHTALGLPHCMSLYLMT